VKLLSDNIPYPPEKQITVDCDAFSFVIIAETMEPHIKEAIKNFLYCYGTSLSSISIPSIAVAGGKPDSIFGSSRSKGCQHLQSKIIGKMFMAEETLVTSTPVKIAIHNSCRKGLISKLCNYPQQFPMEISTNIDICFDPNYASNKPPYGVIVDAILESCHVAAINKHVIHVADIGTRHMIECKDDGHCQIQDMFHKVNKMREIQGISVEMTQIDIAFNIPTKNNALIQCSYERIRKSSSKGGNYRSFVDSMSSEIWALHEIQTENDKVNSKQTGTVRLRQKEWMNPNKIKVPILLEHFTDDNDNPSSDSMDDSTHTASQAQLPNIMLSKIYHDFCHGNTSQDYIEIDANSIYSVKFYSTISHYLTQRRNQLPLTFRQMNDLHKSSMLTVQRFSDLMLALSGGAMKHVHDHGICARLEVSVRPNGRSSIGDHLRRHGHLIDVLAHVHIALNDLIMTGNHKLSFKTSPCELVYAKILQLISLLKSMTRFRASVKFCDIHRGNKHSDWLRAMVTLIMTFTGIAGDTNLKFFARWLRDGCRYNPTNQPPKVLTDLHMNISLDSSRKCNIPTEVWNILQKCLHENRFSKTCISSLICVLKKDKPLAHARIFLRGTSLLDKWHFAKHIRQSILPILLTHLKNNDEASSMNNNWDDIANNSWDDREIVQDYICNPSQTVIYLPSELAYSSLALNQFEENAGNPKRMQKRLITSTQDPMLMMIMKLVELSLLFDAYSPVYIYYLYRHIKLCHARKITLPRGDVNLTPLDTNEQNIEFRALKYLNENRSDRTSLFNICQWLQVPIIDHCDAPSAEVLIASLCHQYVFPCQIMSSFQHDNWHSISPDKQSLLNELISETLTTEIVIELKSQLKNQRHFYLFFQDTQIWINDKINCYLYQDVQFDNSTINKSQVSDDIYVILDKCFNRHGTHGDEMRLNLHRCLLDKEKEGPISNFFLNNDATNNMHFCLADTLGDLQAKQEFSFLDLDDAPLGDESFSNMLPGVIFPCASLLYECNIFFIDKDSTQTHIHLFDKKSFKVITFTQSDANTAPRPSLKCIIFIKEFAQFYFVHSKDIEPFLPRHKQEVDRHLPFCFRHAQKLPSFSKHPQHRVRPAKSIADALKKLLTSDQVNHEHFKKKNQHEDPLDIIEYVDELNTSHTDHPLESFFSDNIVAQMTTLGISSPNSMRSRIQETPHHNLPHIIICPIVCLKYKLWISVWEESNTQKSSYFYCYDPRQDIVVCQVITDHFVFLPSQSHILYIKCSKSNNCGYWQQEELNPFIHPDFHYDCANILQCKYSYLDDPHKSRIIDWFSDVLKMNIVYEHEINDKSHTNCFLMHNVQNPTLIPIKFLINDGVQLQQGVLVFFPFDEIAEKFFGVIVHSQVATEVISKKILEISEKLKGNYLSSTYSFEEISIFHKNDFGCSFFVMLYMYIAHMSKNRMAFTRNMEKLRTEIDVVVKTKQWIVSLLTDKSENRTIQSLIPQWLHQIVEMSLQDITKENKKRNHSVVTLSQPTTSLKNAKKHQPSNNNHFAKNTNQMNDDILNISRHPSKLSKPPINLHQKLKIFTVASKLSNPMFVEFIKHVRCISDLQLQHRRKKEKKKKNTDQNHNRDNDFCVAHYNKSAISAIDFESLLDNSWIPPSIVTFMGNVIRKYNPNIHVFTNMKKWHELAKRDANLVFIPIYEESESWILGLLNLSSKKIVLFNSSTNAADNGRYFTAARSVIDYVVGKLSSLQDDSVLKKRAIRKWEGSWSNIDKSSITPKHVSFDESGVFIILNMVVLSSAGDLGKDTYSQNYMYKQKTRIRIAQIIFEHINWKDFNIQDVDNRIWIEFIGRMRTSSSITSWEFVNQTIAL